MYVEWYGVCNFVVMYTVEVCVYNNNNNINLKSNIQCT